MAVDERVLTEQLAGLDALEEDEEHGPRRLSVVWGRTWPKLAALALALGLWQLVVATGWRDEYVLPGPATVFSKLAEIVPTAAFWQGVGVTARRAVVGFGIAVVVGLVIGGLVATIRPLRIAVGALITGLQTMPSIAWFPLAILLFKLSESAILFVVVIGASPAIANGVISGVDQIPPLLHRAGRVLGAKGYARYRHIVFPAALPGFLAGLKGGWAFAWRSLMAGELIVIIANKPSIGSRLAFEREFADAPGLMSVMLVILIIGIAVDGFGFSMLDRVVRRRRGLEAPVSHRRSGE
jgi:NitT/TauT family transport system permease protein